MTTDADGCLWVADWGGWRITRFAPDGAMARILEPPVSQVTSFVFGGIGSETLYITSASIGLDEAARAAQPLAGGLFDADVGIRGLPKLRFVGKRASAANWTRAFIWTKIGRDRFQSTKDCSNSRKGGAPIRGVAGRRLLDDDDRWRFWHAERTGG